ncbi:hypothetical protein [Stutzerimonas balearica]|uniref:hypothetical protein n=1 Tax=Stutzerimonas balearica TaxID=74829 RepID=UPI0028A76424|nr:hypothetical protein [Stutzerimonas balearica]
MVSFALLTEGETDQVVLEEIIQTVYTKRTGEEVDVRYVQPIYDETTKSRSENFGGWEMLLDFCQSSDRILEALTANDYIVIQIDTDICEHPRIGLNRANNENCQLLEQMKQYIIGQIPSQVYDAHGTQIIFAVAVHSTECWLLTLHGALDRDKNQVLACENRLKRSLAIKGVKYVKDAKSYAELSKGFRRYKDLMEAKNHNESLSHFIDSLP